MYDSSYASGGCPNSISSSFNTNSYPAGRGVGSAIAGPGLAEFVDFAFGFYNGGIYGHLEDQSDVSEMTFKALAVGAISSEGVTQTTSSILSIDESKIIKVERTGY